MTTEEIQDQVKTMVGAAIEQLETENKRIREFNLAVAAEIMNPGQTDFEGAVAKYLGK